MANKNKVCRVCKNRTPKVNAKGTCIIYDKEVKSTHVACYQFKNKKTQEK